MSISRTNRSNNSVPAPPLLTSSEAYEKARPLQAMAQFTGQDHARGDDAQAQSSSDSKTETKRTLLPVMSSSSNEFSLEMVMRVTDTSNEVLKTDDESGMNKSYSQEQDVILSDVSLRQQRLVNDECEYEIDLGNGWITKSISSYEPEKREQRQQQRTKSILSADSSQPISTFQIPFTRTFYQSHLPTKPVHRVDHEERANALFHPSADAQRGSRVSLRTRISLVGVGATMSVLVIVVLFLML